MTLEAKLSREVAKPGPLPRSRGPLQMSQYRPSVERASKEGSGSGATAPSHRPKEAPESLGSGLDQSETKGVPDPKRKAVGYRSSSPCFLSDCHKATRSQVEVKQE